MEAEDCKDNLLKDTVKHDNAFYSTLYRITGNETMLRFGQILLPVFEYTRKVTMGMDEQTRTGPVSRRDLLSVLQGGTPDSFRKAMRRHLEPYYAQLAKEGSW